MMNIKKANLIVLGSIISVLTLAMLVLSSCGTRAKKDEGKVTLKFAIFGTHSELKISNEIIQSFNEKNPGIKVKLQDIPSYSSYMTKLTTQFLSNSAADVFMMDDFGILSFVDKDILMDLNEFIREDNEFNLDDFYPQALQYGIFDNRLYMVPRILGSVALFYNKDLFDEAGIEYPRNDWTWDDFLDAARKLTKDTNGDGHIDQWGVTGIDAALCLFPLIWQNGGRVFNENHTKCLLDSPECVEAIQFMVDLHRKYKVILPMATQTSLSGYQPFYMGRVAMMPGIRQALYFDLKNMNLNWDVALMPGQKARANHVGTWGYAVFKNTKYPKESWKLFKYIMNIESQRIVLRESSDLPSRKSLKEEFLALDPDKHNEVFVEAVKYGNHEMRIAKAAEIRDIIMTECELLSLGKKKDVKQSCELLVKKLDALLKEK